jgi:hypothetical protein
MSQPVPMVLLKKELINIVKNPTLKEKHMFIG